MAPYQLLHKRAKAHFICASFVLHFSPFFFIFRKNTAKSGTHFPIHSGVIFSFFFRHLRKSAQIRAKTAIFAVKSAFIRNSSCCHFSIFKKGASKRRTHFCIHSPVIRPHFFHFSSFSQKKANSFFHPFAFIARSSAVFEHYLPKRLPSSMDFRLWHDQQRLCKFAMLSAAPPCFMGVIWSTIVAGVILPFLWHSSHKGCCSSFACRSLRHGVDE